MYKRCIMYFFIALFVLGHAPHTYAVFEEIPLLQTIIINQVIEIANMLQEIEAQVSRFEALKDRIVGYIPYDLRLVLEQQRETIGNISNMLLDNYKEIKRSIEQDMAHFTDVELARLIKEAERVIQTERDLFLERNSILEQFKLQDIQEKIREMENSQSTIVQQQVMNYSLETVSTQLQTILEVLLDSSKIEQAYKSAKHLEDLILEKTEEEWSGFFESEINNASQEYLENMLYE